MWLGYNKNRSPEIGTVLHWQPPDGHIFLYRPIPTLHQPICHHLHQLCTTEMFIDYFCVKFECLKVCFVTRVEFKLIILHI